jgi:hypothetical protein
MYLQERNNRYKNLNGQKLLKNTLRILSCTMTKPAALLPAASCIFLAILFVACGSKKVAGVTKDFNTGLTAHYFSMQPKSVFLVMNAEVLGHTDIPLGESFVLVNDDIEGMIEKNGNVSAGCSLRISDEKGTILLEEKDLFAGNDVFKKDSATRLKCTINTGKPMEWEKNYNIQVVFWDKYGTGKIINECTIRSIDIP